MMYVMQWVIEVVLIIVSVLGIVLVLFQSNKGSGGFLSGESQNNFIGTSRKGDFLSRLTGVFIAIFIGGTLLLAYFYYHESALPVQPKEYVDKIKEPAHSLNQDKTAPTKQSKHNTTTQSSQENTTDTASSE